MQPPAKIPVLIIGQARDATMIAAEKLFLRNALKIHPQIKPATAVLNRHKKTVANGFTAKNEPVEGAVKTIIYR